MNQTARTFTLVGTIVITLLLMHQLPTLSIGETELRHVSVLGDVIKTQGENQNIDVIPKPDAPKSLLVKNKKGEKVVFKDSVPPGVTMIEDYSSGNANGMEHFYAMLNTVKQLNRPVRIAYFGDSFIEGDIYTSDLREMLQSKFGGNGAGWIDAGSVFNKGFRRTILQNYSGIREFQVVKKPFNNEVQGFNQRYFVPSEGAHVTTKGTDAMPHAARWQNARLFFRTAGGLSIKAKVTAAPSKGKGAAGKNNTSSQPEETGMASSFHMNGSSSVQMVELKGDMQEINYTFTNIGNGTYLYGMSLESDRGVILDNYSMRGSAGFTIANVPQRTMDDFARLRPYDLIILHFGLNVASPKSGTAHYRAYCKRMMKVVDKLRAAFPEASILIMGVPDRDQRSADGITTMKGVEELLACQREMAADGKIAFLDLFTAMGGRASMRKLVEQKCANKDYTHINMKGGKIIGKHVFNSIVAGYDNYVRRKAYENE